VLVLSASAQETRELRIAAASELNIAIEKLAAAFEKQTGIHVVASLGSPPDLFAQLKSGAPFDVFLSADKDFPAHLEEAGLAEPGTFELYGRGVIVLWWRNHGPVGLFPQDFKVLTGNLDVLKSAAVHKIAVVNPEHGPYGRAAVQVLQAYGIYDQVKSKLLLGEDVSEAAQFAQSGDAEIAFIPGYLAVSPALRQAGDFVYFVQLNYSPIDQAAVIMRSSERKAEARRFLEFLTSLDGKEILYANGFDVAPSQKK
jgi:molybdate transport system substrate-binding protein